MNEPAGASALAGLACLGYHHASVPLEGPIHRPGTWICAALALFAGLARAEPRTADAAQVVMRFHDGVAAGAPAGRAGLAGLIEQNFDLAAIADAVLGRRAASPDERDRLARALAARAAGELIRHRPGEGDRFELVETRALGPGECLVVTRLARVGEAGVSLAWRVRARPAGPRIVDVLRDGTSAVITAKSDLAATLARDGIDAAIAELERRAGEP